MTDHLTELRELAQSDNRILDTREPDLRALKVNSDRRAEILAKETTNAR